MYFGYGRDFGCSRSGISYFAGPIPTSVLFNLGKMLIGLYLAGSTVGSLYGVAGSFAVFPIWICYFRAGIFFGAEFMQVCARKRGFSIVPDKNAVAFR
jgi:membrane protein